MHIPSKEQIKKVRAFKNKNVENISIDALLEDSSTLEAFIYSGAFFRVSNKKRDELLKELQENTNDAQQKITYQYLQFIFPKFDWCNDALNELLKNCSIESLLAYFEFTLNKLVITNTCIDGNTYPKDIILSKHSFLLSVLPTAIYIATQKMLPISNKKLLKNDEHSKLLIFVLGEYHSIRKQLTEVFKGTYVPQPIDFLDKKYGPDTVKRVADGCEYFMQRMPENLDSFEIYNDLNYSFTMRTGKDLAQSIEMLTKSGVIKNYVEGQFLHMDFAKESEFRDARKSIKVTELLEYIYGSVSSHVSIGTLNFTIQDLVNLADKIRRLSEVISERRQHNLKHVSVFKQSIKNISKQLSLTALEKNLIHLFCADIKEGNSSDIQNLPLLKNESDLYIFHPITDDLSYEKVLDKILSKSEVKVKLSRPQKGYLFEDSILKMFSDKGYSVGTIDFKKGKSNKHGKLKKSETPEIDGIIDFDRGTVLLVEAKCSIKPEGRQEVFSFVENHLSKAADQLLQRRNYLLSSSKEAEQRLSFKIENKRIIPILVTNHSMFSGRKFVMEDGSVIHCIDELLLRKIIMEDYVPTWTYTGKDNSYFNGKKELLNSSDKLSAILDPVSNLISKEHRTIQRLATKVATEIYKQPKIDRLEELRQEVDLEVGY